MKEELIKSIFYDDPEVLQMLALKERKELIKSIAAIQLIVGPQGEQGIQGIQGERGVQGIQGLTGSDGKDGEDGDDAPPLDPEEIKGWIKPMIPAPLKGPKGEKGKDAVLDTDTIIKLLIEHIKKNKPIDISHIRNADSFIFQGTRYKIHELMNGAGTSTASSALTFEQPAGVIDDSNVTFTVLNEPLFIVVNGAQYKVGNGKYASYAAGVITLTAGVGDGGFIESYYNS